MGPDNRQLSLIRVTEVIMLKHQVSQLTDKPISYIIIWV